MRNRFWILLVAGGLAWGGVANFALAQTHQGSHDQSQQGTQSQGGLSQNEVIFEGSRLRGLNVYNSNNENQKLGDLSDLIIDAHSGQVLYGILSTGMVTGKRVPVPWNAFRVARSGNTYYLLLNKSQDDLANAPTFDPRRPPDFTSQQWKDTVDRFFGVRTVARPPSDSSSHQK